MLLLLLLGSSCCGGRAWLPQQLAPCRLLRCSTPGEHVHSRCSAHLRVPPLVQPSDFFALATTTSAPLPLGMGRNSDVV